MSDDRATNESWPTRFPPAPSPVITAESLIDDFSDALIAVTREGHILFWSRGAETMFGFTREEVMGRSLVETIVPADARDEEQRRIATVLETGSVIYESVRQRKDGAIIYVDVSMQPVTDDNGATRYVATSKKDVTHLRRLREAAVVETTFRVLLEALPDPVVMVNADGRIVQLNGPTERLFGYPRDEILGKPIETLIPDRFGERAPVRHEFFSDPTTRPPRAGVDLFGRRKDGSDFPAEISFSSVRMDYATFMTVAVRDVEARRKADARFNGFLESAPDAVVIVNEKGKIVRVNSQTERLFGYPRSDLLGQSVETLIPARFRGRHERHRSGFLGRPEPWTAASGLELYGLRRDGTEFPADISMSTLETDDDILVATTIRDTSDRKAAQAALNLANRELEAFSYSVSHDLRAPVRGMSAFAQILLDDYKDKLPRDAVNSLEEIRRNAIRMGALIDALLSLSRVARSDFRPEVVDLTTVARQISIDLTTADPARDADFVVGEKIHALMDPELARTLLENLLGNAWKFTSRVPRARIELGVVEREGERQFFVRDNGAGFNMAYVQKLFAPFQRLHSTDDFPGTGIGLATAQRIVHRHGGRIWAEGSVNGGATFYFVVASAPGDSS